MAEFHNFATGRSTVVIPDHRNSVAATIDMDTHSVFRLARYTPEGLLTVLEDDGTVICAEGADLTVNCKGPDMPFAFNGMWRSEVSGLSYMRNRWYSPHLAQFMSHDPLEYIDSYNLYAFASLDPINFWDPWGLDSKGLAEAGITDAAWAGVHLGAFENDDSASVTQLNDTSNGAPSGSSHTPQNSSQQTAMGTGGTRFGLMGVPASILMMNQGVVVITGAAFRAGYFYLKRYWRILKPQKVLRNQAKKSNPLSKSQTRAIRSQEEQIAKHKQKLEDYKSNSDAYDNLEFLKNVSPELRKKVVESRIRSLEHQIRTFEKNKEQIRSGTMKVME